MSGDLHPAPSGPNGGESWTRDQVCHPEEEARWTCADCGGQGCPLCEGQGVLPRATHRDGLRWDDAHPWGPWLSTTPAQRDSIDGRPRVRRP